MKLLLSQSLSSSSTKASPPGAGDNDEHYMGMTEEKHDNPPEKHNDASMTITATVGTTNSLSDQVPHISDDVSSTPDKINNSENNRQPNRMIKRLLQLRN